MANAVPERLEYAPGGAYGQLEGAVEVGGYVCAEHGVKRARIQLQ